MESKTIIIKPVVKAKFSGQSSYSGTATGIEGAQLGRSGYKTGLKPEEEAEYELALNLPKGTLRKSNADFWGKILNINLPNDKPYYFTVDGPMDELKLKVLMEHSLIANNEIELAKNPRANFYIEDAEAKAKLEEVSINYRMEAYEAFEKLATDERKGLLKLYGKKGVEALSERVLKTELFKELEKNPQRFLNFTNDPDIALRISVEEMLEANTLAKRGPYYLFNEETIGTSIDDVVEYFKELKNQSKKIAAQKLTAQNKK